MTSLDALEELKKQFGNLCFHVKVFKNDETFEDKKFNYNEIYFDLIEKELKALKIIKNKGIDIDALKYHKDLEHYNFSLRGKYEKLTQEEYDLVKDILL